MSVSVIGGIDGSEKKSSPRPEDLTCFVEADDGTIAFTQYGRDHYASYFGYAGIDSRRVRTREDRVRAEREALPDLFTRASHDRDTRRLPHPD
jgi:hypothetical protein